jgi:uncharacterized Zn finger protein
MGWSHEAAHEQKEHLQRQIDRRLKRGETMEVLTAPSGSKKLCTTFWGQAWCRNLEAYQVYDARLPRGRSCLRQGRVFNLDISAGRISALVAGADLYEASVHIQPLSPERWQEISSAATSRAPSMLDLLAGRLGDDLMQLLTNPEHGLFPNPKEIRFDCSCPDYADLCEHTAAALYGTGLKLDADPALLFTLRGVDPTALLATASSAAASTLPDTRGDLSDIDLSALFGIDLQP